MSYTAATPGTISITATTAATLPRDFNRNAPCPCGSGKKYKRCHNLIDHETSRQAEIERRAQWAREAEQARAAREELLKQGRSAGRSKLAALALMALAVNK